MTEVRILSRGRIQIQHIAHASHVFHDKKVREDSEMHARGGARIVYVSASCVGWSHPSPRQHTLRGASAAARGPAELTKAREPAGVYRGPSLVTARSGASYVRLQQAGARPTASLHATGFSTDSRARRHAGRAPKAEFVRSWPRICSQPPGSATVVTDCKRERECTRRAANSAPRC